MNCRELHEYLIAFLDSELDAALSIEVQRHLDRCPECAREAEIERTVRGRTRDALAPQETDASVDEAAFRRAIAAAGESTGRFGASRRRPLTLAVVVGIAIVATLLAVRFKTTRGDSANLFAQEIVADFAHFIREGKSLEVNSDDPAVVADWLSRETALTINLPTPSEIGCRLVGARKCQIAGRNAAFALYEMNGVPASLVIMTGKEDELRGMRQRMEQGLQHWTWRGDDHTVMACPRDGLLYAAVSTLPEDQLLCLMTGANHEGH